MSYISYLTRLLIFFTHAYFINIVLKQAESIGSLPKWNFDGSSTGQAPGDDSEVILHPQAIFTDPFRPRADGINNILVMCDCWTPAGEAIPTNTRAKGKNCTTSLITTCGRQGCFYRQFYAISLGGSKPHVPEVAVIPYTKAIFY